MTSFYPTEQGALSVLGELVELAEQDEEPCCNEEVEKERHGSDPTPEGERRHRGVEGENVIPSLGSKSSKRREALQVDQEVGKTSGEGGGGANENRDHDGGRARDEGGRGVCETVSFCRDSWCLGGPTTSRF